MSRTSFLRVVLAILLVLAAATPMAANTAVWHWGTYGRHPITDTDTDAGARCQYDPVSRSLSVVRVRAPTVLSVDRTGGPDPQRVGARAWLERRSTRDGAWVKIASTPLMTGTATNTTSPFRTTMGIVPKESGDVRVVWVLSWYGPDGTLTGRAIHRLDHYLLRIGSVTMRRRSGSCPVDQGLAASIMVSHGSRSSPRVALTFDMGGRLTPALDVAAWLIEHDVPATIFATGATGSMTPVGQQVLGVVAAHPELFLLGNHSWDHPSFPALTHAEMADQLQRTDAALTVLTEGTTRPWFRPPYGSCDSDVLRGVGAAGWGLTVRWDVVTTDYLSQAQGGPTSEALVEQVLSRVQNGSIVIMHLGGYQTLDALPAIMSGLAERGLEAVTLATLLGL